MEFAEGQVSGWLTPADLVAPKVNPYNTAAAVSPWRSEQAKYLLVLQRLWEQCQRGDTSVLRINVYTWWRAAAKDMPLLARAARRLLAPRATSVASESLFSLSGSIASKQRTKMADDTLRILTLLGAWHRENAATAAKDFDTTTPDIPIKWAAATPFTSMATPELPFADAMEATAHDEIADARYMAAAAAGHMRGEAPEAAEGEGEEREEEEEEEEEKRRGGEEAMMDEELTGYLLPTGP
jgi:hypothetical protein